MKDKGASMENLAKYLYNPEPPTLSVRVAIQLGVDVNFINSKGETPLMEQVQMDATFIIAVQGTCMLFNFESYSLNFNKEMLKAGANVNVVEREKGAAIHRAVKRGRSPSILKELINHGADPNHALVLLLIIL